MQSSALHLPRCIDAIYERPTVLSAKNTSRLLTGWTSNETKGQKIGLTAFAAGLDQNSICLFHMQQVCLIKISPQHSRWASLPLFGQIFYRKQNELNSACLKHVKGKQTQFPSKSA